MIESYLNILEFCRTKLETNAKITKFNCKDKVKVGGSQWSLVDVL